MTDKEYAYCESKWIALFRRRATLYKEIEAINKEMNMLDKNVLFGKENIENTPFPYSYTI